MFILYNLLWLPFLPFSMSQVNSNETSRIVKEEVTLRARRLHFRTRLSLTENRLPNIKPGGIWIHALSAGEVLSALPLAKILYNIKSKLGLSLPLYMSASTISGYKILRSSAPALDRMFVMPFDAPWLIKSLVDRIRPSMFVLIEGDVWPNLIKFLKSKNTRCFLVNARMSPISFRRYQKLFKIGYNFFNLFDAIFVASPEMKKFYGEFVSPLKLFFMGNIKYDAVVEKAVPPEKRKIITESLGIREETIVWTAGSLHRGEEDFILNAHREVLNVFPEALLILAPRNVPQDVDYFVEACRKYGFTVKRRSTNEKITVPGTVYIVDTLGELMLFYSISNAAFVGGSLVPKGGHNLLEPAIYGIPVCWGPHVFNFHDIAQLLKGSHQGVEIRSDEDIKDFLVENFSRLGSGKKSEIELSHWQKASPTLNVLSKIFNLVNETFLGRSSWR